MTVKVEKIKGGVIVRFFENGCEVRTITITGKAAHVAAELRVVLAC